MVLAPWDCVLGTFSEDVEGANGKNSSFIKPAQNKSITVLVGFKYSIIFCRNKQDEPYIFKI